MRRDRGGLDLSWARSGVAGAVREVMLSGLLGPILDLYTRRRTIGRENLTGLEPPVLFVANHSSHVDTPTILRALPRAWRRCTAVAAAADYFYRVPWIARVVSLAFNTVPVYRNGEGVVPDAASDLVRLIDEGGACSSLPRAPARAMAPSVACARARRSSPPSTAW